MLIAAGGTGGHIYPALAVARCLAERSPEADFLWLGGRRGLEQAIVPAAGYELRRLWLRSLRTVDLSLASALDPLRLAASYPQALALLARWRPRVVFTTGGYAAIPVLAAAATLRVPSVLWEGNLMPGRSVRATARLASVITVSFGETCAMLPGRCYVTGTPIRSFEGTRRDEARARLGLPPEAGCLLVFGGSQAVRRLNSAVFEALPAILPRAAIIHVTGEAAYAEAMQRRGELAPEQRSHYRPFAFLGAEMIDALVAADLLVGRAGSSTLAEATAVGLPMVVVPYPYAGAHQAANARRLEQAGAARLVPDEQFDAAALIEAAGLLEDERRLAEMRAASLEFGRPRAAAAVAQLALALAERSELPSPESVERASRAAA
jgi:UDP-N-acetylglucosamine--N-acetylmuramyl-(pentapeptide) pyrophosphoryl-undecaprenol N-acetylglucosamine transferase